MESGLGILVVFLGYSTLYYGITQVRGGNWGFLDLTLPWRWNEKGVRDLAHDPPSSGGGPQPGQYGYGGSTDVHHGKLPIR